MTWFLLYAMVAFSYLLPIVAVRFARVPTISPLVAMVFVFFMEYGPHALNQNWRKLSATVPDYAEQRMIVAIAIANAAMAFGIVATRLAVKRPLTRAAMADAPREWLISRRALAWLLLVFGLLYSVVFIGLDALGAPRLRSIIEFLLGSSQYEYHEIRRELFAGTIVEAVENYTRQSTSVLILLLLVCSAWRYRGLVRLGSIAVALLVFITSMMQLNKFPVVYALGGVAVCLYVLTTGRYHLKRTHLFLVIGFIVAIVVGLYGLYNLQYADALDRGLMTQGTLQDLIFYRAAFTQADALRLWFVEFPDRTPFLGIANINLFASLFDIPYFDVSRHIPIQYEKVDYTTFQVGYVGSGYASFGYLGTMLYGLLAGIIATVATIQVLRLRHADLRVAFCAALVFNMYFLSSREFTTALLSGGIAPLMILAMFMPSYAAARPRRAAVPPVAEPAV